MPPSQLKQLKASLKDSGVLGPQKSKKQKKQNAKSGAAADTRVKRNAALADIRERFNPFEYKAPTKSKKFDVTTRDPEENVRHRPGVTKSLGEERRKETLLKELHSRKKVGALLDRRFGEDDPTMTPEERAAGRFARASQKKSQKDSLFNLEDDDEEIQLTHLGRTLDPDAAPDDFEDSDLEASDEGDDEDTVEKKRKRWQQELEELQTQDDDQDGDEPQRKKSKQEVMKEIIAKSKFHKYERQKAKEDDDDIREMLDKGLPEVFDVLRGVKKPEPPKPAPEPVKPEAVPEMGLNPDRAALISGKDREQADREYDMRLKQMAFDKRSQPQDRTKTAEELAEEQAERLRKLEEERLRRMKGEEVEEESEQEQGNSDTEMAEGEEEELPDDAKAFGLQHTLSNPLPDRPEEMGVEDEDEFVLDSDLVDSDSEAEPVFSDLDDGEDENKAAAEAEEKEFVGDLQLPPGTNIKTLYLEVQKPKTTEPGKLAYTYPCPESHQHFLEITKDVELTDLPVVVQRIRALHHPKLHPDNKTKLAKFTEILVQHVAYLANQQSHPPFGILENMLRHVHSLAKLFPEAAATAFRNHLRDVNHNRPLALLPGDLVVLTGVSTVFPTSDHFHPVVTPSNLIMARYLSHGPLSTLGELVTGTYVSTLCLQYQSFAKRYMPEYINYTLTALCALSPVEAKQQFGSVYLRQPDDSLRLTNLKPQQEVNKLRFWDTVDFEGKEQASKLSVLHTLVTSLDTAAIMWSKMSAFSDIFTPARRVLRFLSKATAAKLPTSLSDQIQRTLDSMQRLLKQSEVSRRPLLLHNHRPLAIKTAIPKFEDDFNPDRHYDPDRERAELAKLKAEHKRERKGALRELRKDANFIARESLREKRERDEEYHRKYRRLIAEVQGEEGKEANAYERLRRARKGLK